MALSGKQIHDLIELHRHRLERQAAVWDRWHRWYLSEYWRADGLDETDSRADVSEDSDSDDLNLESNYPYAFIDTMIANVCPTNPQVTVTANDEDHKGHAMVREALLNDTLRRNEMHDVCWEQATQAAITGRAITKVVWDFERKFPKVVPIDPRNFFWDTSCRWDEIRYACEVTVVERGEFEMRTKPMEGRRKGAVYDPEVAKKAFYDSYPQWLREQPGREGRQDDASLDVFEWVVVYEFYDLRAKRIYHMLEGQTEPLFEDDLPFRYVDNPFSLLVFNKNLLEPGGVSDIKLIAPLQERLNEIDTLELWHAHSSISFLLFNSKMVDDPAELLSAIRNVTRPGQAVEVKGQKAPIRDIVMNSEPPSWSPQWDKMRQRCTQLIEFTLGLPQYARGSVGQSDVATELALTDAATRTRNGRRVKIIQDHINDVAEAAMGIWLEFMPDDMRLPLRVTGNKTEVFTRIDLGMGAQDAPSFADTWVYDLDTIPYSPTENHRMVQLQKLAQYLDVLAQSQFVDQRRIVEKLLELLGMSELATDPEAMADVGAQPAPPAMPPQQPNGGGGMGPVDTAGTGAVLGEGIQDMSLPPEAQQLTDGTRA